MKDAVNHNIMMVKTNPPTPLIVRRNKRTKNNPNTNNPNIILSNIISSLISFE
jgi:hypothetical protein